MKCRDCTNLHLIRECKNLLWCDDLLDAPNPDIERNCKYFKRATNGDRIRTMTDSELASFLPEIRNEITCILGTDEGCPHPDDPCFNCWLDWLKRPVNKEGRNT